MRNKFCFLLLSASFTSYVYADGLLSASSFLKSQNDLSSGIAITTKQTGVAANQVGDVAVNTYKTLADAKSAIDTSNRVVDAVESYGSAFGQPGSNNCQAILQNGYNLESKYLSQQSKNILIKNYVNQRYSDTTAGDSRVLSVHKNNYCTVAESKSGFCQLNANGMQGWDSDYSGFSSVSTLSPEAELAGYAYTASITDQTMTATANCKTTDCESASMQQLSTISFNSLIASALIGQITDRRIPEIKEQ